MIDESRPCRDALWMQHTPGCAAMFACGKAICEGANRTTWNYCELHAPTRVPMIYVVFRVKTMSFSVLYQFICQGEPQLRSISRHFSAIMVERAVCVTSTTVILLASGRSLPTRALCRHWR